jgi:hypothetical protein
MAMFAGRKTGRGVIAQVKKEILKHGGPALALAHNGKIMLSSGPHKDYLKEILPDFPGTKVINNTIRAQFQAAAFEATRVGDTKGGDFVFGSNRIYDHFFGDIYPLHTKKAEKETYKVEAFISREFVKNADGHVFTAICGADKKRVFYREELPTIMVDIPTLIATLMKAKDIETINGVPVAPIRKLYNARGYDAAYRLICLGELRILMHYANQEGSQAAYRDYLIRKELYLLERKDTYKLTKESSFYVATDGSIRNILKHERPIYNLSPDERFQKRCDAIARWVDAKLQPVVTDLEYTAAVTPAARPTQSSLLRTAGMAA